jgi:hypothetical protein
MDIQLATGKAVSPFLVTASVPEAKWANGILVLYFSFTVLLLSLLRIPVM